MKNIFTFIAVLLSCGSAMAHALWIETAATGSANKKQEVKVFYGEYSYSIFEEVGGDTFNKVKDFELWAVAPNGEKTLLTLTPSAKYYSAWFTPKANGTYTIVLDNNKIDVLDFTQYNFGIFKTHYHATAKVNVGNKAAETATVNPDGITITDVTATNPAKDGATTLRVLYKGQPAKDIEVAIEIGDQWGKKLKTNDKGEVRFTIPFKATYLAEATTKEEVPGTYNGKEYQFIWHCATYTLPVK
jgi:uncharacterized GH25 family protein